MWQYFLYGCTTIGGVSLGIAIVGWCASWLGKVWANRILEEDKKKYNTQLEQEKAKFQTQMETLLQDMRTQNTKELFVHKLQFEKEFEIYKELWVACLEFGNAMNNYYSYCQTRTPESFENDDSKILKETSKKLDGIIFSNRPFYSPKVWKLAREYQNIAAEIAFADSRIRRKQTHNPMANTDNLEYEKISKIPEMNQMLPLICEAIRERIWSTDKTGWDRPQNSDLPEVLNAAPEPQATENVEG